MRIAIVSISICKPLDQYKKAFSLEARFVFLLHENSYGAWGTNKVRMRTGATAVLAPFIAS